MSAQSHNHGHFSTVAAPTRCDGSGNPCHIHTDRQGNVRAVVRDGNLVEANDYYPYGMLMADADGKIPDKQPYKLSGKEYITTRGLNLYDFGARMHDPAAMRFSTPDPLMEQYPSLSPYTYCAANPMKYIDPTGMKIRIDAPEYQKYIEQILNHLRNDNFFGPVMTHLDKYSGIFTITMTNAILNKDGKKSPAYYEKDSKTIFLHKDNFYNGFEQNPVCYYNLAEELYHAFQYTSYDVGDNNIEFEAHVAAFFGTFYKAVITQPDAGFNDFINYAYETIANDKILRIVLEQIKELEEKYIEYGNKFAQSHIKTTLPHYGDPVYYMTSRMKALLMHSYEKYSLSKIQD